MRQINYLTFLRYLISVQLVDVQITSIQIRPSQLLVLFLLAALIAVTELEKICVQAPQ
jgi:hypothetical protein